MRLDVREVPREDTPDNGEGAITGSEGVLALILKKVQSGAWSIQDIQCHIPTKQVGVDEGGFAIKEGTPFRVVTMIIEVMPKEDK